MEWINVKDGLPEHDVPVLAYVKGHHLKIQLLGHGVPTDTTWYCWVEDNDITEDYEVTHWQPLPKAPK